MDCRLRYEQPFLVKKILPLFVLGWFRGVNSYLPFVQCWDEHNFDNLVVLWNLIVSVAMVR